MYKIKGKHGCVTLLNYTDSYSIDVVSRSISHVVESAVHSNWYAKYVWDHIFSRAMFLKHIIHFQSFAQYTIVFCLVYHLIALGYEWIHGIYQGEVFCNVQSLVEARSRHQLPVQ